MSDVHVIYATREGHTAQIAERLAADLRKLGLSAVARDVTTVLEPIDLSKAAGVVIASAVHFGHHEKSAVAFVKKHVAELADIPTAFLSISATEASAEDASASTDERAIAAHKVDEMLADFFTETGWHPRRVKAIAGAMLVTQYGRLIRFMIKRIAAKAGHAIDTTVDHDYTDWNGVDRFAEAFAELIAGS